MNQYPISDLVRQLEETFDSVKKGNENILAAIAFKNGGTIKLEDEFVKAVTNKEHPLKLKVEIEGKKDKVYVFTVVKSEDEATDQELEVIEGCDCEDDQ